MKSLGLADAGYEYVGIDDCYSEKQRNPQGDIVASAWSPRLEDFDSVADARRTGKERFPSGMRKITDEIHSLGLKAGIVSQARSQTHP